jgi:hypothetical protein
LIVAAHGKAVDARRVGHAVERVAGRGVDRGDGDPREHAAGRIGKCAGEHCSLCRRDGWKKKKKKKKKDERDGGTAATLPEQRHSHREVSCGQSAGAGGL